MKCYEMFADAVHLEHVKKSLWRTRPYGKAAVMIGAGFSMNAEPRNASVKPFPTWRQLADRIYEELYPVTKGSLPQHERTTRTSASVGLSPTRLASEYEVAFGRENLDRLLMETIPYDSYGPGQLHALLLSLPWSDIFTTNYDPLLEDTRAEIADKKYDLVLTAHDIPLHKQPRIVKLHGTFPSNRPFIVTEEDYRTYPAKFAPFVNLVQQALMENTFCLMGFSGDDPNFLSWLGWVRDNLGEHTPKLYLCGILNLSGSERRLLQSRNVVPIDLSPLFPADEWPDSPQRHFEAIKWLLEELHAGRPPYRLDWPIAQSSQATSDHSSVGDQSSPGVRRSSNFDPHAPRGEGGNEELLTVARIWRAQRESYPGWVVCPLKNRSVLWDLTKYWIQRITSSLDTLSNPHNLLLLRELNWRLEKALVPIPGIEGNIERVLRLFNPFPKLLNLPGTQETPENKRYEETDWKEVSEAWLDLAFAIIRKAREQFAEAAFREWMNQMEGIVHRKLEWQPRYWYEWCLFHLSRLDLSMVNEVLNKWPAHLDPPFWKVRRASIMAETGERVEAARVMKDALKTIKGSVYSDQDDYSILSQEGWAMLLDSRLRGGATDYERGRWAELSPLRCDPRTDIEIMSDNLDRDRPFPPPEKSERFLDGRRVPVYHLGGQSQWERCLPAFAFLRLFEEGGLPVATGTFGGSYEAVGNSAKWVAHHSPEQALSFFVRSGNQQKLKEWFDRLRAAELEEECLDRIVPIFLACLKQSIREVLDSWNQMNSDQVSFAMRTLTPLSHVLSEICFRISSDYRAQLFDLIAESYGHSSLPKGYWLRDCVGRMLKKALRAMSSAEIIERMDVLLGFPIPGDGDVGEGFPSGWVEPFENISWEPATQVGPSVDLSKWQNSVNDLLRLAENGSPFVRTRAVQRLNRLYEIGTLSQEQSDHLAQALWSRQDPQSQLPTDTLFRRNFFLWLPEAEPGQAKERFRSWILKLNYPSVLIDDDKSTGWSTGGKRVRNNLIIGELRDATVRLLPANEEINEKLIDWTPMEAEHILERVARWWDENKRDLSDPLVVQSPWVGDQFRQELSQISSLFAEILLPRLKESEESSKKVALRVLNEMDYEKFPIHVAEPMTLFIDSTRLDEVVRKLRHGLASSDAEVVKGCVDGIYLWFLQGLRGTLVKPPEDLVQELVNLIVSRKQPGLLTALAIMATICRRLPEELNQKQMLSLSVALEYLMTETELPDDLDAYRGIASRPTIPLEERPEHRQSSAELAHALYRYFSNNNQYIPQVLHDWKEICGKDVFPEVRRAWPREAQN
jgi:hypothetical protein